MSSINFNDYANYISVHGFTALMGGTTNFSTLREALHNVRNLAIEEIAD